MISRNRADGAEGGWNRIGLLVRGIGDGACNGKGRPRYHFSGSGWLRVGFLFEDKRRDMVFEVLAILLCGFQRWFFSGSSGLE